MRWAKHYVLQNQKKHAKERGDKLPKGYVDVYSTWAFEDGWKDLSRSLQRLANQERDNGPPPVAPPNGWLLRNALSKTKLLSRFEQPRAWRR